MKTIKIPRIYFQEKMEIKKQYSLSYEIYHYCINVLRMKKNEKIEIFNDKNYKYLAKITNILNKNIQIEILKKEKIKNSSKIYIHLMQAIHNYDIFKWIIQKSTELGVDEITPIFSKKSQIKKNSLNNMINKLNQWNKIAIAACMQSGRNNLPKINPIKNINMLFIPELEDKKKIKIICHPKKNQNFYKIPIIYKNIELLIGPKSGFTKDELEKAIKNNFFHASLGKNILKSETATMTSIIILQFQYQNL